MQAEIIAIGSELTTGAKLDTNSQWLSRELSAIGIPVRYHVTMADDLEAMIAAFRTSVDRSELVLITGGIGPTLDDLTRQAVAGLADVELVLHEPSLEIIKSMFVRRKREMPERNAIQAMFPRGSEPISNPRGSAPGISMQVQRTGGDAFCRVIVMPGVPSEMKRMFEQEVLPGLSGSGRVIRHARINCFGVGESAAEEMLGELTARDRDPEVGITVHEATITMRITAHGNSEAECQRKISEAGQTVREKLGEFVFGVEDEELEHIVVRLLRERGLTLATAESGTGGLLAHRLTDVAGFEGCYLGGVVVPTDAAKREMLEVDGDLLKQAGSISAEAAAAMAGGCHRQFGTDFALAITECPWFDPDDSTGETPIVYVALVGDGIAESASHAMVGDPAIAKSRAAKMALNLLRLKLLEID
ncbi:MAG: CinA family nicotinamide mononucleotide deamidase-related protein [Planctomycetaceae bacterium]|jgi:nicotinamide-nucleotide amidase|nr:CinA family nicotinamide mononucleotide deamidase-related protein [Planctomycetaceae bacterium]MBT6486694.1 CinA family nicotinamide mononucleotide deamidase-related protein [Planctomycetaceae bacterium]MBT6493321.1 CinA family nicotinamide mononucleotide deamidase-related protein [Planctomycetaceae bacterium]